MYFTPEICNGRNYSTTVNVLDVQACLDMYSISKEKFSDEYVEIARLLKPDVSTPSDPLDALELYLQLNSLYIENQH